MNPCEHALCSAQPAVAHNTGSSSLVRLPRDTDIRQGANRLAHVTGFTEFLGRAGHCFAVHSRASQSKASSTAQMVEAPTLNPGQNPFTANLEH